MEEIRKQAEKMHDNLDEIEKKLASIKWIVVIGMTLWVLAAALANLLAG